MLVGSVVYAPSHSRLLPSITPSPRLPKIMRDSLARFQAFSVDAPIEIHTGGALVGWARGTSIAIMRDIQTLFDSGTAGGLSDQQLLERFASRRDASADAAFEVLVLRHGPMVLRVCRNVLGDSNDAHDAFQATFLVLVRRRASIRRLESVGGWLYGVACRVAARARVEAARRRAVEQRAALRVVEALDSSDAGSSQPARNSARSSRKKSGGYLRNTATSWCFATGKA